MPEGDARASHWDLMLEQDDALATWAMDAFILEQRSVSALRLPDHRKAYLTYEGEVSRQRGHVTRVASGTYEIVSDVDDCLTVKLDLEDALLTLEILKQTEPCYVISTREKCGPRSE